jgi:hypothetical protein
VNANGLAKSGLIFIILNTLLLTSCGGGGGSSGSTASTPTALTLSLGTPATTPAVIPPSANATQVTFLSMVTGTALPPDVLLLDEVDANKVRGIRYCHEPFSIERRGGKELIA